MEPLFKVGDKLRFKSREDMPIHPIAGWNDLAMDYLYSEQFTVYEISESECSYFRYYSEEGVENEWHISEDMLEYDTTEDPEVEAREQEEFLKILMG